MVFLHFKGEYCYLTVIFFGKLMRITVVLWREAYADLYAGRKLDSKSAEKKKKM